MREESDIDFSFLTAYLIVDVFCIMFGCIILSKARDDLGSEMQVRTFRRLMGCYLTFVANDALWISCATQQLGLPHWLFTFSCTLNAFSVATTAFYWFDYASSRMGVNIRATRARIWTSQIPLMLLVMLYVSNLWLGWVFSISEEGVMVQGPLYVLAFTCEASFLAPVTYMAIRRLLRAKDGARHTEDLVLVSFIVIPTLGGIFDLLVPNMPVMAPSLFASILYVFVSLQESRIFDDALTGLNNRRRADAYLAEQIVRASDDAGFWFFLGDVDSFKAINDRFGHLEGDRALRLVADALRLTASERGGFAARWGGDEFVLVVGDKDAAGPQGVVAALRDHLQRRYATEQLPYSPSISVGYAHCSSPADDGSTLLAKADAMLYKQKQVVHGVAA